MITPRTTRLVRAADLQVFREAAARLSLEGAALAARDRLVVVPTRAAAEHLTRCIEDTVARTAQAAALPDFATPGELVRRFAERLPRLYRQLSAEEREVLLRVACRHVIEEGTEPPFRVRPGLVAEMLRFYDELRRHRKDVDTFERLALGLLEPGASDDRGARQLVQQTRFLAAVFREFERRSMDVGTDEHMLRSAVLAGEASLAYRHVVVTVGDQTVDAHGLAAADWDLLARAPGVERIDVVVTDRALAGTLHERIHTLLPGIQEVRFEPTTPARTPHLAVPHEERLVYVARDREEEVAIFARRVKLAAREGRLTSLDRAALVVNQPLPYVYLARSVFGSADLSCQLFDALPLAAEPFAAAVDLVLTFVSSGFARSPGIQLLRSPHFRLAPRDGMPLRSRDITALDRAMTESGYAGDIEVIERLVTSWGSAERRKRSGVLRAGAIFHAAARALAPLRTSAAVSEHLATLQEFVDVHEAPPDAADPLRTRTLRARRAVRTTIAALRDAHAEFDHAAVDIDELSALLRRWIDGQTFAPRAGTSGVHLVDSASAPFGGFEHLQLAGLVDGEWPARPRRNIFYATSILRELGWPSERERSDGARAAFADLLRSPDREAAASSFLLEHDTAVGASPLIDELATLSAHRVQEVPATLMFDYEALGRDPIDLAAVHESTRDWARFRSQMRAASMAPPGRTDRHQPPAYSLSALERYQDCPFRFFASDVLRLEEPPDDGSALSPRARGRFVHDLLQRFFAAWDARGDGPITPARVRAARAVFAEVAAPLLVSLPPTDAALERARLFGSALSVGIVDVVLALEASSTEPVRERWLEYRLDGEFSLGDPVRRVVLRGVADRIDLLDGNRLRVIDYKTGAVPERSRALQVPVYALCAQERLTTRDGLPWTVDEAQYVSFKGGRSTVRVVKDGQSEALAAAREQVFALVGRITAGEFPPRPHDPMMCSSCAYSSVCRKDYVD